jgi:hypothetical protein
MRQEDLHLPLRRRPFLPFRIYVTDGSTYDIHHPDQALPTHSTVFIGIAPLDPLGLFDDRPMTVSLLHVIRLEPIGGPPTSVN